MELDYDAMKFWFDVFLSICLVASLIYNWIDKKSRVNKAEIEVLTSEMIAINNRLLVVEADMRAMPSHEDLGRLYERINGMSADVSEMAGAIKAMTNQLSMINQHLISEGK
jgi:hypothetical protein